MTVSKAFSGYSRPDWYALAACSGKSNLFMLTDANSEPRLGGGRRADIAAAKALCESCPARLPCLELGIEVGDHGVWGGLSPIELRAIRRRKRNG